MASPEMMHINMKTGQIGTFPFVKPFIIIPSFIKELVKVGYLTHQSGKWWEGSYQDGGLLMGCGSKDRQGGIETDYRFCEEVSQIDFQNGPNGG